MEIIQQEQSIALDFVQDDILFIEWCDCQTRGMREIHVPGFRKEVKSMMEHILTAPHTKDRCTAPGSSLYIEAENHGGYFSVTLAYVPEEDLMPWQWLTVCDYFRERDFIALIE